MFDRKTQPPLERFKPIDFIKPEIKSLNNKARLYFSQKVPNNTSRLELYFDVGNIKGKTGLASITSNLLFSGSKSQTAVQIQECFDELGAFKDLTLSQEECVLSIYALNSKLPQVFDVLYSAINEVVFPQNEVDELLSHQKQSFEINMQKVGFLAKRKFIQEMYKGSIYGNVLDLKDIENTSRDEIVQFHKKHFLKGLNKATLVGNIDDLEIDIIGEKLKKWAVDKDPIYESNLINNAGHFYERKEKALQSAIKIGKSLFTKKDPQYMDFFILNTAFGGYFGSRLMSNLREDKGYTYGVGSYISELHKSGTFVISTQVGSEYLDDSINQIRIELEKLCLNLISQDELDLVKNYLLGQLLKSADGAYAMMNLHLSLQKHDLNFEFYKHYVDRISSVTPKELKDSAKQHFVWEDMTVVCSG